MYAANVDGQTLTFDVSAVWRRNMIIRDRQTGTLWQHATGEGLIGPLRGRRLQPLGGEQMTWAAWKTEHPTTWVALAPEKWPGFLPKATVEKMLVTATNAEAMKLPGLHGVDRRLSAHELVAGVEIAGEAKAYPIALLHGRTLINDRVGEKAVAVLYEENANRVRVFDRTVDGHPVTLHYTDGTLLDEQANRAWTSAGRPLRGTSSPLTQLPVSHQRWMGWSEFHPGGLLYGAESNSQ